MIGLDTLKRTAESLEVDDKEIEILYKLFILLYADDTIIFAETPEALQTSINALHNYCNTWGLKVNVSKTKVMVFF